MLFFLAYNPIDAQWALKSWISKPRQHNPRCACPARVTVLGSVCLSVKSHLTYGASIRSENAVTYSAGNEGQKIYGDLPETQYACMHQGFAL